MSDRIVLSSVNVQRVLNDDGEPMTVVGVSEGTGVVEALGMLELAKDTIIRTAVPLVGDGE